MIFRNSKSKKTLDRPQIQSSKKAVSLSYFSEKKTHNLKLGIKSDGKINFAMTFIDTPGYSSTYDIKKWYKLIEEYTFRKVNSFNFCNKKFFFS